MFIIYLKYIKRKRRKSSRKSQHNLNLLLNFSHLQPQLNLLGFMKNKELSLKWKLLKHIDEHFKHDKKNYQGVIFLGRGYLNLIYFLNRCPTKKLKNKTPYEAWSGLKPSVGYFKIFGLLCYKHVLVQLRKKLEDRGQAMILVGYLSTCSYKLFSPN